MSEVSQVDRKKERKKERRLRAFLTYGGLIVRSGFLCGCCTGWKFVFAITRLVDL